MNIKSITLFLPSLILLITASPAVLSQVQIPTLQACNGSTSFGGGTVHIDSRQLSGPTGTFDISLQLRCDPTSTGFPAGALFLSNIDMNDSFIVGSVEVTKFEQMTTTGTEPDPLNNQFGTPTTYLNAQCQYFLNTTPPNDTLNKCRIWVMIADNRRNNTGTPDIVSFLVFNAAGQRIAYGTGPLVIGDITVKGNGE